MNYIFQVESMDIHSKDQLQRNEVTAPIFPDSLIPQCSKKNFFIIT